MKKQAALDADEITELKRQRAELQLQKATADNRIVVLDDQAKKDQVSYFID